MKRFEAAAEIAGAIRVLPKWCWKTWHMVYQDKPAYLQTWACQVFEKYPNSLCLEAMQGQVILASDGDWKLVEKDIKKQ
jgi:hypothetical protein